MAERGAKAFKGGSTKSVVLCGVGGQGIILATDILAQALLESGFDVKVSEVHGMSQRGGSVHAGIRFGEKVHSPLVEQGSADYMVAFEILEALRWASFARRDAAFIAATRRIDPLPVLIGRARYPEDAVRRLLKMFPAARILDAISLAARAGNERTANLVLLGAVSTELPIEAELWSAVIETRVPSKTVEANLRAFEMGRGLGLSAEKCAGHATTVKSS